MKQKLLRFANTVKDRVQHPASLVVMTGAIAGYMDVHDTDGSAQIGNRYFPAEPVQPLSPMPNNQVLGFTGHPSESIDKIRKSPGKVFFVPTKDTSRFLPVPESEKCGAASPTPQWYAISRSSLWKEMRGQSKPTIYQIEVPQEATEEEIKKAVNYQDTRPQWVTLSGVSQATGSFGEYPALTAEGRDKLGAIYRPIPLTNKTRLDLIGVFARAGAHAVETTSSAVKEYIKSNT